MRSRGLNKPESREFPIVHVPGEVAAQAMSLYPVVPHFLVAPHHNALCGTTALGPRVCVVRERQTRRHSYFLRHAQT